MTTKAIISTCLSTAVALTVGCSASGPVELEAKSRGGVFNAITFDDASIQLEDTGTPGAKAVVPPELRLVTYRLPPGTSIQLLGHETAPTEGGPLAGVLGEAKHEKGEAFDGTELLHGLHAPSGAWQLQAGGAPPRLRCTYELTVDVEGRGAATIEDSAHCGHYFVALVDRFLDDGSWLDMDPADGAKGHLFIRRQWEGRPGAKQLAKKGLSPWTVEGTGKTMADMRYIVVAKEVEAEKKACKGYRDAAGMATSVFISRTQTELALHDMTQREKPVAVTTVPSRPASCPKTATRGASLTESADVDAERAWVKQTLASL